MGELVTSRRPSVVFKIQSGGKFATFGAAQCIQNTENNVWSSPPPLYWKCSCKSILCFGNTLGKPTFTIRIGVMKDNFVFDHILHFSDYTRV